MQIDLSQTASQTVFARLVGVSPQAVSKKVAEGVLLEGGTLQDWLLAYCGALREVAAGRGGDEQHTLTGEKARQTRIDADLKELQYYERIGRLVSTDAIEPVLDGWASTARAEFTNAVDQIVAGIESRHGITVDRELVDKPAAAACKAIASYPALAGYLAESGGLPVGADRERADAPLAG